MGKFGGFYKGEKKKKKKSEEKGFLGPGPSDSYSSAFTLPQIISKKKKEE